MGEKSVGSWKEVWRQVVRIGAALGAFVLLGTLGYYLLGHSLGRPASLLDCLYMTIITLSTVGYAETIPVAKTEAGRLFTILLILSEESVLRAAGIERAKGLLAALGNDHDNLFLVLTARSLNPNLRIIARGSHPSVVDKMLKAGADEVVLPETTGGLRMVSLMVRPTAVSFLDQMLRQREVTLRVEEVVIEPSSPLVGKRLSDLKLPQQWNILVLAYRQEDGTLVYNPPADLELRQGMALIVMGDVHKLEQFRQLAQNKT